MFKKLIVLLVFSVFLLAGCAKGGDCNSIVLSFDKDPNNLSGDVNVGVGDKNHNKELFKVIVLLDGKRQGEFFSSEDPCDSEMDGMVMFRTQFFANGPHMVSTISKDSNLAVVCQSQVKAVFNNELSDITLDKGYVLGKDFHFSALSLSKSANYTVEVNDFPSGDTTIYSQSFAGNINAVIPPKVFAEDSQMYQLVVKDSSGNIKFEETVGRDYDQEVFEEDEDILFKSMADDSMEKASVTKVDPYKIKIMITVGSEILAKDTTCGKIIDEIKNSCENRFGKGSIAYFEYGLSSWCHVKPRLMTKYPNVKIWIHFSHGRPPIPGLSQAVEFSGEYVSSTPNWRETHALTELGFQDTHKLNFVWFHACYGAATTQYSEALGIEDSPGDGFYGELGFMGWIGAAWYKDTVDSYNEYTKLLFHRMIGFRESLQEAMEELNRPEYPLKGKERIADNLELYGVADAGLIFFNYPDVTKRN